MTSMLSSRSFLHKLWNCHYSKHHKGYVTNLNAALEKYHEAETKNEVASMIALQSAIKFNGGGHINHSIFWTILAPVSQGVNHGPKGDLAQNDRPRFWIIRGIQRKVQCDDDSDPRIGLGLAGL